MRERRPGRRHLARKPGLPQGDRAGCPGAVCPRVGHRGGWRGADGCRGLGGRRAPFMSAKPLRSGYVAQEAGVGRGSPPHGVHLAWK